MRTTAVLLAAAVALGCAREAAPVAEKAPAAKSEAAPALAGSHGDPAASAMPAPASALTGTILETMDAAGYTYVKLKTADGEAWAAVNAAKVAKGDTVTDREPDADGRLREQDAEADVRPHLLRHAGTARAEPRPRGCLPEWAAPLPGRRACPRPWPPSTPRPRPDPR